MRYKLYLSGFLAVVVTGLSTTKVSAGSVIGSVRDIVKSPPANGVSGAKVSLRDTAGKQSGPVITNTEGQYQIVNVANGQYTLVVAKVGYVPSPHDRVKIVVQGNARASDVMLTQAYANRAYYSTAATIIVKKLGAVSQTDRGKVLTDEWELLRAINLPPSSKAILADELNKQDTSVMETLPDLRGYVASKPEAITTAQRVFSQALAGKGNVPAKASLNDLGLSHEIIADVVLFQVKASDETVAKKKAFVNDFMLKWDNTPESKRFMALQKGELWASR